MMSLGLFMMSLGLSKKDNKVFSKFVQGEMVVWKI